MFTSVQYRTKLSGINPRAHRGQEWLFGQVGHFSRTELKWAKQTMQAWRAKRFRRANRSQPVHLHLSGTVVAQEKLHMYRDPIRFSYASPQNTKTAVFCDNCAFKSTPKVSVLHPCSMTGGEIDTRFESQPE